MRLYEAVRLALAQIRVQKLKSFVTLVGVAIGVMFLIAVVSIVEGWGSTWKRISSARSSPRVASPGWLEVDGGDITRGRDFTTAEEIAGTRVVIINDRMAERLFGESEPLGKTIMIRDIPFEVIGLYAPGGSFMGEGERPRDRVAARRPPQPQRQHRLGRPDGETARG